MYCIITLVFFTPCFAIIFIICECCPQTLLPGWSFIATDARLSPHRVCCVLLHTKPASFHFTSFHHHSFSHHFISFSQLGIFASSCLLCTHITSNKLPLARFIPTHLLLHTNLTHFHYWLGRWGIWLIALRVYIVISQPLCISVIYDDMILLSLDPRRYTEGGRR